MTWMTSSPTSRSKLVALQAGCMPIRAQLQLCKNPYTTLAMLALCRVLTSNKEARCCRTVASGQTDGLAAATLLQNTQAMALTHSLGAAKVACMYTSTHRHGQSGEATVCCADTISRKKLFVLNNSHHALTSEITLDQFSKHISPCTEQSTPPVLQQSVQAH
jgi:hypothetical protein